jgi:hypothetical protein
VPKHFGVVKDDSTCVLFLNLVGLVGESKLTHKHRLGNLKKKKNNYDEFEGDLT